MAADEDKEIQDYFIETAFPLQRDSEAVVELLAEAGVPIRETDILSRVNVRQSRLRALLKVLEVEGIVERNRQGWLRTLNPWTYDTERVNRVTQQRRQEQAAMRKYVSTKACLMEFLRRELDDPDAGPCGRCANCTGKRWNVELDPQLVREAQAFLRSQDLVIQPRLRWPTGLDEPRGVIPEQLRHDEGRVLSIYNDGGWGKMVKNIWGAFGVRGPVARNPVLLVDDMIDSRWTLAVVARDLRDRGSGAVIPFALADSRGR